MSTDFPGGSSSDDYHFNISSNSVTPPRRRCRSSRSSSRTSAARACSRWTMARAARRRPRRRWRISSAPPPTPPAIGTGIEWNDSTSVWQNVNWGTVWPVGSLPGLHRLANQRWLEFPASSATPLRSAISNTGKLATKNMAVGRSIITGPPGPGSVSTGAQHDPATYVAFARLFATDAAEILAAAGLPAISIGIDSADPTGALRQQLDAQRPDLGPGHRLRPELHLRSQLHARPRRARTMHSFSTTPCPIRRACSIGTYGTPTTRRCFSRLSHRRHRRCR